MKKYCLKVKLRKFCFLLVSFVFLIFQANLKDVKAVSMDNYQNEYIVEELRLIVPSKFKEEWLSAEQKIWEPWLSLQDGFLGRQIFWDKEKEEALILVNWRNKKLWKSISIKEVNKVQKEFEESVKSSLNVSEKPFKLIYEGDLAKQE